jgi:selenocysteine lyase/cysteine desulfurase
MKNLEKYFSRFRKNIIGDQQTFVSPYGRKKILYADWIASGRLYLPIEKKIHKTFGPYIANTHTETNITGVTMTKAYHAAQTIIKKHVNANSDDVLITAGFGMTTVVNKFQRILGIKLPSQLSSKVKIEKDDKPVVFITHMEHHSNHTSWQETIADLIVIPPDKNGCVDIDWFRNEIKKYSNRKLKIGSFSAGSNVTGIIPPFHKLAKIMHENEGVCFVDFAASAPYVTINMHPKDPLEKLDAIMFSPHKFLGGPGSSGALIFDKKLYTSGVPDHPGGGTVRWTNPWGGHTYFENIEAREDGGTPGFLQAIRTALSIRLKEELNPQKMRDREKELLTIAFNEFRKIDGLVILADNIEDRLGIISFYFEKIHFNLVVKLLNDRFGIQVRGGCSCAGTYGHYLLHIAPNVSKSITDKIDSGDLSAKPGWVRLSMHPTMTNDELVYIIDALKDIQKNITQYEIDYTYDEHTNRFMHNTFVDPIDSRINEWLTLKD